MATRPWTDPAARALSALLALAVFGATGVVPFLFGTTLTPKLHSAIGLMLLGASAAAVHAAGFRPQAAAWRIAFSGPLAWLLIAAGAALLLER